MSLNIILTSIFVDDQAKALDFYTAKLGFVTKQDVPVGAFRWLTVVSPDSQDGTELLLEPSDNPIAREYKKGLVAQGIPAASFGVSDIKAESRRLKALGVRFTMEPTRMGPATVAVFDDTCGNLIQIMEQWCRS